MLLARFLGAGKALDIYNAAFAVPDVLLNIFIAGALSAAFIPVFSELLAHKRDQEANQLASAMLTWAPISMGGIAIGAYIAMPWLAPLVAPGFSLVDQSTLVQVSRLMLLSPILFALSNTLGSMLVAYDRFTAYGLSPILYNLGIICGIGLAVHMGPTGLAIGTLAGATLHLTSRIVAITRSDFRPTSAITGASEHLKRIARLMLPRMAGQPVEQLTFLIFTNIASSLGTGSVAILSFARNFQSVPVAIFGISLATAVFGSLSRSWANHDRASFERTIRETLPLLLGASLLSTLFYLGASHMVVKLLLGSGRFDVPAIAATSSLLSWFSLSIPAESCIHLLVRGFYAIHDTWTPILISIPGLMLIWLLSTWLTPSMGINGLALAYTVSVSIEALFLGALLARRLRQA
jgi:putative peptidoglycan lipid II flippase